MRSSLGKAEGFFSISPQLCSLYRNVRPRKTVNLRRKLSVLAVFYCDILYKMDKYQFDPPFPERRGQKTRGERP